MSENNQPDLDDIVKQLIEKTDQVHDGIKTKTFISLKRLSTEIEHDLKVANLKKTKIVPSDYKAPISTINDKAAFMKRLESFSTLYITADRPLTALECALHGWHDTHTLSKDSPTTCIIQCLDCKNEVEVIRWKAEYNKTALGTETIKEYKNGLYDKHTADCQWHQNMCKSRLYSLNIKVRSEGFKRFKQEASNLLQFADAIPKITPPLDDTVLDKIDYVIQHCEGLMDCGKPTDAVPTHSNYKDAYLLALFGWRSACKLAAVHCDLCFAKHSFQPNSNTPFHAIHSHQSYCPWINDKYGVINMLQPKLENEVLSGSEWMVRVLCLEYDVLFNMMNISSYGQHLQAERTEGIHRLYDETQKELKGWNKRMVGLTQPL
ncbi:hypothetical protein K501DRAFT_335755 [Backusella circina FSU 941]|nr:hypothetical protein K501DRAFT_335755 [Backusella circina FSU 941]